MKPMNRREALKLAAAIGATLAWRPALGNLATLPATPSQRERRDLYPEGVASGDPHPDSVLLWTRRPPVKGDSASHLTAQVSTDEGFKHIVATAHVPVSAGTDWTCRVLAAGLSPRTVYWYRFTDEHGNASRVGRTITSPTATDDAAVKFAFVSCQNNNLGACNAYRRMIWSDEQSAASEQLGFVLHLGDFVYELVWYPEDKPGGYYDRRVRDLLRYPNGEKHEDFYVPTDVDGYRTLYRAYLADPDLQDARARWPFICMWDNHEFSWRGWQSQQNFGHGLLPAQTRKVAAARAWWEYQPSRAVKVHGGDINEFVTPKVVNTPLENIDDNGLGDDPDNLAAIGALTLYRTFRYGSNVDLILTDNRSYRSEPVSDKPDLDPFEVKGYPYYDAAEPIAILAAGRAYANGNPPATIDFNGATLPNTRMHAPPGTILGAKQKQWFLEQLRTAQAPWKIWGNSIASLDWRTDLQHLPPGAHEKWVTNSYGVMAGGDWSEYRTERGEICESVRANHITGFVSVAGDRHAFVSGLLSTSLPPDKFEPAGVEFVTGSISAPTLTEGAEHKLPKDHPLRALYFRDTAKGPASVMNAAIRHGVRTCLTLQETGDEAKALAARNPDVAPHLSFADLNGNGYTTVRASGSALDVEFVCIPRPVERDMGERGGGLLYRIGHHVPLWRAGESPRIERTDLEGTPPILA